MNRIAIAYITNPNKKTAEKIAREILKKGLASCANIFPIESIYIWEGRPVKNKEWALLLKTTKTKIEKLQKYAESIHPYRIPCVLHLEARANMKFYKWINE